MWWGEEALGAQEKCRISLEEMCKVQTLSETWIELVCSLLPSCTEKEIMYRGREGGREG